MLPKCWLLLKVIYRAIKEVLNRLESYQMFVHDVCIEKFTPNFLIFYQILKKICWKWQNLLKKWKNGIFSAFFILDFFQNHERYKKIVFTGMDWMHWGTFKPNIGSLNPETKKSPYFLVNSCLFCTFLGVFDLNGPPGQHLGNTWGFFFLGGGFAGLFSKPWKI